METPFAAGITIESAKIEASRQSAGFGFTLFGFKWRHEYITLPMSSGIETAGAKTRVQRKMVRSNLWLSSKTKGRKAICLG